MSSMDGSSDPPPAETCCKASQPTKDDACAPHVDAAVCVLPYAGSTSRARNASTGASARADAVQSAYTSGLTPSGVEMGAWRPIWAARSCSAVAPAGGDGAAGAAAGRGASRVAVVDFDVHHGDGTEDIVRRLVAANPAAALCFASSER